MENTFTASAKYLVERGLQVAQRSETALVVGIQGDRTLELLQLADGYRMSSWACAPGPGEDDFICPFATLDALLLASWCFYFAKPIEISGWQISLHRRPYWSIAKLQYRLADLAHVTEHQMQSIKETRQRQSVSMATGTLSNAVSLGAHSFILAGTREDEAVRLLLRRDLEEGYVVSV
ncbi:MULTISPECIES: hypothetical protein [Xanthomonas]|uniref:hypothetical protein n=1 Tax=Xanthomonas TaxID=338 RepID=UPI000E1E3C5A|nr:MULTISPECIES: hypothetical protein [Xanthomonas]